MGDFWEFLGEAGTSYLDVVKQQEMSKAKARKTVEERKLAAEKGRLAQKRLEAARLEAKKVAVEKGAVEKGAITEAPGWQKYLPWLLVGGIALFAFKK